MTVCLEQALALGIGALLLPGAAIPFEVKGQGQENRQVPDRDGRYVKQSSIVEGSCGPDLQG